ncbi:MAG: hypothetical protein AABY89_00080 [Acidobacteriota bacterium]
MPSGVRLLITLYDAKWRFFISMGAMGFSLDRLVRRLRSASRASRWPIWALRGYA